MSEYIYLQGSEQVQHAASSMRGTTDQLSNEIGYFTEAVRQFGQYVREFTEAVEGLKAVATRETRQPAYVICAFCGEGITCAHGNCPECEECRECYREIRAADTKQRKD